jgi:serine/threonine-protein kinase HipA
VWLPGAEEPVPAGIARQRGSMLRFRYGRRYLARPDAIALYAPELPLEDRWIDPPNGLEAAGCLTDAAPDSWGRGILERRLGGDELSLLTYLTHAGSDRIGALDLQPSPAEYVPRSAPSATLEDLAQAAQRLLTGEPIPEELDAALTAGSSVGGARPKALLHDAGRPLIAKFSAPRDTLPMVRGEMLAMRMAARCGLDVAAVELTQAHGRDVLLVERFDRTAGTAQRRMMVSALTMLGLPDYAPRDASYARLAELMLLKFADPVADRRELFRRIVFNVLCGNTDDHARNHAAFWDGSSLSLTPAYDICPYPRGGHEATQAMIIGGRDDRFRFSQVQGCIERASLYGLSSEAAQEIVHRQLDTIRTSWDDVCDEAHLTSDDRRTYRRVFPHEYALIGLD